MSATIRTGHSLRCPESYARTLILQFLSTAELSKCSPTCSLRLDLCRGVQMLESMAVASWLFVIQTTTTGRLYSGSTGMSLMRGWGRSPSSSQTAPHQRRQTCALVSRMSPSAATCSYCVCKVLWSPIRQSASLYLRCSLRRCLVWLCQ